MTKEGGAEADKRDPPRLMSDHSAAGPARVQGSLFAGTGSGTVGTGLIDESIGSALCPGLSR